MIPRPPISTLFPYTTLFRSQLEVQGPIQGHRAAHGPLQVLVPTVGPGDESGVPDTDPLHQEHRRGSVSGTRSEEHTSELQSRFDLVCRLLLEKKKKKKKTQY